MRAVNVVDFKKPTTAAVLENARHPGYVTYLNGIISEKPADVRVTGDRVLLVWLCCVETVQVLVY